MLELTEGTAGLEYSVWSHPVGRVLKFRIFKAMVEECSVGGTVLDYGCGDRPYEAFLLQFYDRYIAVDHQPSNQLHGGRPDLYLHNGRVNLPDASVDCTVLTEVLEHVYEPLETLREIWRLLRPGGILIGSVPFAIGEHEAPFDYYRYTSFCLERMFEDTGFEVGRLQRVGDLLTVLMSDYQKIAEIGSAACRRARIGMIGRIARKAATVPVWIGLRIQRSRFYPQNIARMSSYPLGFVFVVRKRL